MFDSTKLEHKLTKEAFKEIQAQLRNELLDAQRELRERGTHSIMILINGADGAGKGEVLNRLYEWLDPRYLETISVDIRNNDDNDRPNQWHYWRDMPPKGTISAVLGSWYHVMLRDRALGKLDRDGFMQSVLSARAFETMLGHEGVKVLKLWLHIDFEEAERRHKEERKSDHFRRPLVEEWADVPAAHGRKSCTRPPARSRNSSRRIPCRGTWCLPPMPVIAMSPSVRPFWPLSAARS